MKESREGLGPRLCLPLCGVNNFKCLPNKSLCGVNNFECLPNKYFVGANILSVAQQNVVGVKKLSIFVGVGTSFLKGSRLVLFVISVLQPSVV